MDQKVEQKSRMLGNFWMQKRSGIFLNLNTLKYVGYNL